LPKIIRGLRKLHGGGWPVNREGEENLSIQLKTGECFRRFPKDSVKKKGTSPQKERKKDGKRPNVGSGLQKQFLLGEGGKSDFWVEKKKKGPRAKISLNLQKVWYNHPEKGEREGDTYNQFESQGERSASFLSRKKERDWFLLTRRKRGGGGSTERPKQKGHWSLLTNNLHS